MFKAMPIRRSRGFTLTELMVVVGLIALLISMLLPALSKVRAAANATACTANLRQMGTAWTMYVSENRGRLPHYIWSTPGTPDIAWQAYWPGILDRNNVRGESLLCPTAREPIPFNQNGGFGNVHNAWNGKFQSFGSVLRFNIPTFRIGSYGYNRSLTVGGRFTSDGHLCRVTSVKPLSDVPLFFDCVFADALPSNGSETAPVSSPPNLTGANLPSTAPEHWRFMINRHGKGINVCMADGSVKWVPLEDMYQMTWTSDWMKYRLTVPAY